MKKILVYVVIIFFLLNCTAKEDKTNIANYKLAEDFGIDSVDLIYQYYQKFGFTDLCEDLRMVSQKSLIKLNKKLPIDSNDLKIINNFPNKTDKINGKKLSFNSTLRQQFKDIELVFIEFKQDSMLLLSLENGEYEIKETKWNSTLKIYDNESGLYYIEIHQCDGN